MSQSHYMIGIDEAGVGPVLGPMTVGGVLVKVSDLGALTALGIRDSKVYGSSEKSRQIRKNLAKKSIPYIQKYQVECIEAAQLDQENMYDLEVKAIGKILAKLDCDALSHVYIAQIGQMRLQTVLDKLSAFGYRLQGEYIDKIIYEVDADAKFIPVSLASILAKTKRDDRIESLCASIGMSYISGYPNYKTADFLNKYVQKTGSLPPETRKSRQWEPLQQLLFP